MNDPAWHLTASDVISGLTALLVAIIVFYGRKHIAKLEELDAQAVRKHDLKELEERMEESRRDMHSQNQSSLREINDNVKDTRRGLDTLVRDLMNRGGRP